MIAVINSPEYVSEVQGGAVATTSVKIPCKRGSLCVSTTNVSTSAHSLRKVIKSRIGSCSLLSAVWLRDVDEDDDVDDEDDDDSLRPVVDGGI